MHTDSRTSQRESSPPDETHLSIHNDASVGVDDLSRQLKRICRRQEYDTSGNLRRLAWSTHGTGKLLDRIRRHGGGNQRRPDWARSHGIHSDTLGDKLVGETSREGDNGALGGSVIQEIGSTNVGVDGGVVDDGVALSHVGKDVFGEVEECCKTEDDERRGTAERSKYTGERERKGERTHDECWWQTYSPTALQAKTKCSLVPSDRHDC